MLAKVEQVFIISQKILFVTNDFGPRAGGIESFIVGLIESRPFGSTIVYTSAQPDCLTYDAHWLSQFGVQVIRDRATILLPTARVARAVSKIVKVQDITVVAFGAAAPLGLLSAAIKRAGVLRTVALTHGHEVWWSKIFPFNLLLRRIGSTVDALAYLGDFTKSAIASSLNFKAQSALVKVAPGVNIDHFSPRDATQLRRSLGLTDKKVIVSVGRLVHRKGQDHLIESMPQILQSVPDAHLVLIGEGPYRRKLEKRVAKLKVGDQVTFIGRIQYQGLPEYMSVGQVFAMPSRSRFMGLEVEGLGIVYLEASACGLPVIAGASGGAPDAVVDGKSGLIVDGVDNSAIARAVISLLNDPEKSAAMGRFGRQWVIDHWRWQIWSQEFELLLSK